MPSIGIVSAQVNKRNQLTKIRMDGDNNEKINEDDCYAVVYKGVPYIIAGGGYFPIEKRDNDFFYTGKMKTYKQGAAIMGALMFGLPGAMIAGSGSDMVEFRLDYMSGVFGYHARAKK